MGETAKDLSDRLKELFSPGSSTSNAPAGTYDGKRPQEKQSDVTPRTSTAALPAPKKEHEPDLNA